MSKKDPQDDPLVTAVNELDSSQAATFPLTEDDIAELIADIASSPIDEAQKAMLLYTIAKGTFNEALYHYYIDLLSQARKQLEKQAEELRKESQQLQDEIQSNALEMGESLVGGLKELKATVEHIENKTLEQAEKIGLEAESEQIQALRENLKKDQN